MKRLFGIIVFFLLSSLPVSAATCFYIGAGSGNYNDATRWSSSSGGAGSSCAATSGIPKNAGDVATFDANSASGGGATITVDIDFSIASLTITGAFVANLNFGAHNMTLSSGLTYGAASSASGTITCGTGTFTFTGTAVNAWSASGATIVESCASVNINIAPASAATNIVFIPKSGGSYGPLTLTYPTYAGYFEFANNSATFASFTIAGTTWPPLIIFNAAKTFTFTAAPAITATIAQPITWTNDAPANVSNYVITTPNTFSCKFCLFTETTLTNATTMTQTWSGFHNTNLTATAPAAGSGNNFISSGN